MLQQTKILLKILIPLLGFLTAMAIHSSLWGAPLDMQQGGNSRISYVHLPVAWMSIFMYLTTAMGAFIFLVTKFPFYILSSRPTMKMGAVFTFFTLVTGSFWGKPMWGTFWVWDARLTSVLILLFLYLGALLLQKHSVQLAPISICLGLIDIPIVKSSVNWWNTLHQPASISQSGASIHPTMLIPILANFANLPIFLCVFFLIETRISLLSFHIPKD